MKIEEIKSEICKMKMNEKYTCLENLVDGKPSEKFGKLLGETKAQAELFAVEARKIMQGPIINGDRLRDVLREAEAWFVLLYESNPAEWKSLAEFYADMASTLHMYVGDEETAKDFSLKAILLYEDYVDCAPEKYCQPLATVYAQLGFIATNPEECDTLAARKYYEKSLNYLMRIVDEQYENLYLNFTVAVSRILYSYADNGETDTEEYRSFIATMDKLFGNLGKKDLRYRLMWNNQKKRMQSETDQSE